MSVPDLTGDVKRASRVVVEGVLPGTGEPVRLTTDAFEARALQHEIDHCAGCCSSTGWPARTRSISARSICKRAALESRVECHPARRAWSERRAPIR